MRMGTALRARLLAHDCSLGQCGWFALFALSKALTINTYYLSSHVIDQAKENGIIGSIFSIERSEKCGFKRGDATISNQAID